MALYLQARQIEIWQFSNNLSTEENVKVALTKMACFRQAVMDEMTLESYTLALKGLDLRAFQVAMAVISETHKKDGETAFPDLGYVLDVMDEARERFTTPWRPQIDTAPVVACQKAIGIGS
jgi:hypothetical protein